MNLEFLNTATAKELEQFKAVCNQLLSRTYVVRTLYRPGRGRVSNPDYTFLSIHYESVREYLSLLDWDLRHYLEQRLYCCDQQPVLQGWFPRHALRACHWAECENLSGHGQCRHAERCRTLY